MNLLVDIGNSRIKWGYWHNGRLHDTAGMNYHLAELVHELDRFWQSLPPPQQVHVSCVAGKGVAETISAWTEKHWRVQPQFAHVSKSAHGVVNSYSDYTRLGIDRWLALIAVHGQEHGTACIIDCGTAITIDGLQADGRHMGGLILPGLDLMRESLYSAAPAIAGQHEPGPEERHEIFARSTNRAVDSGCRLAAAGAVEMVHHALEKQFNDAVDYIITGGDAEIILPGLSCRPRHDPHLVLHGLAIESGVDS